VAVAAEQETKAGFGLAAAEGEDQGKGGDDGKNRTDFHEQDP
jgi:hypothetical protein